MTDRIPAEDPVLAFGDDRSPGSDLAWLWINSQSWAGWTLQALTAHLPPVGPPVRAEESTLHPSSEPAPRPTYTEAGFVHVDFLEATVDPRLMLSSRTDDSLLVLGPANEGLGPFRIGSTTEYLLHDPPSPLLVARHGRPVRRVMVCADGSPHAARAAAAFTTLPLAASADTFVVAVDDGRTDPHAAIQSVTEALHPTVVPNGVRHRTGKPHREILEQAQSDDVDLIVLGTRGLSALRRLTLGSTAGAIARSGTASVLTAQAIGGQ